MNTDSNFSMNCDRLMSKMVWIVTPWLQFLVWILEVESTVWIVKVWVYELCPVWIMTRTQNMICSFFVNFLLDKKYVDDNNDEFSASKSQQTKRVTSCNYQHLDQIFGNFCNLLVIKSQETHPLPQLRTSNWFVATSGPKLYTCDLGEEQEVIWLFCWS